MTATDKFTETMNEINELHAGTSLRANDLQCALSRAIAVLKRRTILGIEAQLLISQYSIVETLAGISRELIEDLIEGFKHYANGRRAEYVFVEDEAIISTQPAIYNLNRILNDKGSPTRSL